MAVPQTDFSEGEEEAFHLTAEFCQEEKPGRKAGSHRHLHLWK